MAQNDVTFIRGEGGLGRPPAGLGHVAGFILFLTNITLPTGWATAWVTATAFVVGDVVVESTIIYRCLIAHTSGVFATDLAAVKWVVDETATTRTKTIFSIADAENLGVAEGSANHGILWYHINEFFRIQPKGELWVYLGKTGSITYTEHKVLQDFAEGRIRKLAMYDKDTAFATANVTTLQASIDTLKIEHKPLQMFYAADIVAVTDLSTLSDLRLLSAENVSVVIGEDGNAAGRALALAEGKSITTIGTILGAQALAAAHESIAWIAKFDLVTGKELDVPAFANTQLNKSLSPGLLDGIHDKGYIFIKKHIDISGTFANESSTSIALTSDFAFTENAITIDKAVRGVRTNILPNLSGPLLLNANGTLSEETIAILKNDADRALEAMQRDGEISGDLENPGFETVIDPNQDVLATSLVKIQLKIIPVGVARNIEVTVGFTVSLT